MSSYDNAVVEVRGLTHRYGERLALDNVSFSVPKGQIFGFLGPNGGGKTTLFRVLSTLMPSMSGAVRVCGMELPREAAAIRHKIGVVFQHPSVDVRLTVLENLRHQGHLYGLSGAALRARTDEVASRFGLADRARELVGKLSGGLQRRVELAKSLLHRPEVLVLDEPSTGLDPGARLNLWEYLVQLRNQSGVTVLLTTHLLEEAEKCDRLAILNHGRLVAEGSPRDLKAEVGGEMVAIQSPSPEPLHEALKARLGLDNHVVGGVILIQNPQGQDLVGRVMKTFPEQIESITIRKPTLEDVFMERTGQRFYGESE